MKLGRKKEVVSIVDIIIMNAVVVVVSLTSIEVNGNEYILRSNVF
jgi:hypothetical protein